MIDKDELGKLLEKEESPVLEFKREWYWTAATGVSDMGQKWGEFYKDLVALCNGYLDYVGQDRFLIFGFCEKERQLYNIETASIEALKDLRAFRRKILERLERLVSHPPLDLEVATVLLNDVNLLVLRIPSPKRITELKSELTTKTRTLDAGAILVRKGQENDSVRLATSSEILELSAEFERYKTAAPADLLPQKTTKERSITKTVQLYIERNSSYSVDLGFPVVHRDWSENIIFELYRISENLGATKYFLYVHEHSSKGKTYGYLKQNKLVSDGLPLIILTESPSIKDTERRKDNIKQTFNTPHVFFFEEFGRSHLYADLIQNYERYNLPIFVESLTNEPVNGGNSALLILNGWYHSVAEPLMVVKGYGGIGKTTLVKQFLDNINKEDPGVGLLFIDSNEIIDRLLKAAKAEKKIDDLYDFYLAQSSDDDTKVKTCSKDLLSLSVDNGSLVVVLDGLDEVIAKLGTKFDISSFVTSIVNNYSDNLERAKILITCRDNFWRESQEITGILEITLTPFTAQLAREFFEQAFDSNSSKVSRAMDMADKFALKISSEELHEPVYIPYVLDMIAYLIKHKSEFDSNEVSLGSQSQILNVSSISNDFLIGSVCEREIKKLGNYSVDNQINFLIDFSVAPSGYVSLYDVKGVFEQATSLKISDEFVEKLKGHPLLCCADNRLYFRYDFFYQYFNSLYVARYFKGANIYKLDDYIVDILGTYVGFDNGFSSSLCARMALSEDLLMFALETIDTLKVRVDGAGTTDRSRFKAAISGTFALLLSLQRSEKSSLDITACNELLKQVFWSNDCLDGVCLVNIMSSERAKPIFDFRGMTIINSHFERYEYFWDCHIDERTRFKKSHFLSLEPRSGTKPQIYANTFEECDVADIIDIINKRASEIADESDDIKGKLYQFFKLFYKQGNFYPKKQEDVRARIYTGKLLPTLIKHKVIADYQDPKKATLRQYKITDEYRPIIKLFEQGGASLEFERVVNLFVK